MPELEDRIRTGLREGTEGVSIDPDALTRIRERRRRSRVVRASAGLAAAILVITGVAISPTLFRDRTEVSQVLGPGDRYTRPSGDVDWGFWPYPSGSERARETQDRADEGEDHWQTDPTEVARRFAREFLSLEAIDVRSSGASSREQIMEAFYESYFVTFTAAGTEAPVHRLSLAPASFEAKHPVWFVSGLRNDSVAIELPIFGDLHRSPLHVRGRTSLDAALVAEVWPDLEGPSGSSRVEPDGGRFSTRVVFPDPAERGGFLVVRSTGEAPHWSILKLQLLDREYLQIRRQIEEGKEPENRRMQDAVNIRMQMLRFFGSRVFGGAWPDAYGFVTDRFARAHTEEEVAERAEGFLRATPARLTFTDEGTASAEIRVFRAEGDELTSFSTDVLRMKRDGGEWFVDEWSAGQRRRVGETVEAKLLYPLDGDGYMEVRDLMPAGADLPLLVAEEYVFGGTQGERGSGAGGLHSRMATTWIDGLDERDGRVTVWLLGADREDERTLEGLRRTLLELRGVEEVRIEHGPRSK